MLIFRYIDAIFFPWSLTSDFLYFHVTDDSSELCYLATAERQNKYSEVNPMENEVFKITDFRKKYYLSEFQLFDGEEFITFNIVDINTERNEITVAVTDRGKISVITYDLKRDGDRFYFEYGVMCDKIKVDDFEEADE